MFTFFKRSNAAALQKNRSSMTEFSFGDNNLPGWIHCTTGIFKSLTSMIIRKTMFQTECFQTFVTFDLNCFSLFTSSETTFVRVDFLTFFQGRIGFTIAIDVGRYNLIGRLITVYCWNGLIAQWTDRDLNVLSKTGWTLMFVIFNMFFAKKTTEF